MSAEEQELFDELQREIEELRKLLSLRDSDAAQKVRVVEGVQSLLLSKFIFLWLFYHNFYGFTSERLWDWIEKLLKKDLHSVKPPLTHSLFTVAVL